MGLPEKITDALQAPLRSEYIRLEDDDGISGFVVSREFEGMSTLDRQQLIDQTLQNASEPLSPEEQRQILVIAALTPVEFETVGAQIRVHRIKELGGGSLEVMLRGGYADAVYVRGALKNQKGVKTTEPKEPPGAVGVLMTFAAKGSETDPLTKDKAIRILNADPYIEVVENA